MKKTTNARTGFLSLLKPSVRGYILRYVILVSISLSLYIFFIIGHTLKQVHHDNLCYVEISHQKSIILYSNSTKEELIGEFIREYDIMPNKTYNSEGGKIADALMTCRQVHPDSSTSMDAVLSWLTKVPIIHARSHIAGIQPKFQFILEGGYKAVFKFKRYERSQIAGDLSKDSQGRDRHNGEIAAYHLQRVLGFNRGPFVVGRRVSFLNEVLPVADDDIKNHVVKKGEELCINVTSGTRLGKQKHNLLCTSNGYFEGAVILWIPRNIYQKDYISEIRDGFQRSIDFTLETNRAKYLDYMDSIILDYLIQNIDRHIHYYEPASNSALLLLDNGKSFGDPYQDCKKPLLAFKLRCVVRKSTFERLQLLSGGVLGSVLRIITSRDPIAPILWEPHYEALDRRAHHILEAVHECISIHGRKRVLLEDDWVSPLKIKH